MVAHQDSHCLVNILLMDEILHHLTTLPWKGRMEVVQDFGPSTCFAFPTVVAPMLSRENEGSKKTVWKVVQDVVHQQYVTHCCGHGST